MTELAELRFFYRDRMFLGYDRVGNGLCRDRIFHVETECCKGYEILCYDKKIMLRHGWPGREDFCRDIIFYVAIELAKVRKNFVTTGNGGSRRFSVVTGLLVSQQRLS